MQPGDPCVVFDGHGYEAQATIETVDKKSVRAAYHARRLAPRDHDGHLHLAIAMPKGDRQRSVIEKLVELGVDRLTPIETDRSVSKFDDEGIDRLNRYSLEACKQSHRNRLLQIDPCCKWQDWLKGVASEPKATIWVLHPASALGEIDTANPKNAIDRTAFLSMQYSSLANTAAKYRLVFAIGPEGGFTAREISAAAQVGSSILDLGERILRVETAVSVAAILGSIQLARN
jgi:16S rRNA (uracil1498-N3)-methyltransferase